MGNQQGSLNEDWMSIPGHDGYYADAQGMIWSLKRSKKIISQCVHVARGKKRYCRSKVSDKTYLSHRLIASAMIGRPLEKGEVVNHKNGNTVDNKPSNLEVVSHRDNVIHAVQNGLYCSGPEWYAARGMSKD